jgi:hypothetical protein
VTDDTDLIFNEVPLSEMTKELYEKRTGKLVQSKYNRIVINFAFDVNDIN